MVTADFFPKNTPKGSSIFYFGSLQKALKNVWFLLQRWVPSITDIEIIQILSLLELFSNLTNYARKPDFLVLWW